MGTYHRVLKYNDSAVSYTFSNGTPIQLTEYAAPLDTQEKMRPELALFAQDQWKLSQLTLNVGLRLEYLHSFVPAINSPATLLVGARSFAKVDCVPCWKDVNPRFGASYDLFSNGKTALKASLGRYVQAQTRYRLQGNLDMYNALNVSPPLAVNSTYGPSWLVPQDLLDARLFKVGFQIEF
jgi:hypothetical protein